MCVHIREQHHLLFNFMEFSQVLTQVGLKDKEPEIYLALLKFQTPQPASSIANHLSMNRSTVYKSLLRMAKVGLVTKTKKADITTFLAEDPEIKIQSMLNKQLNTIESMSTVITEAIPLLVSSQFSSEVPKVRYYEGVDGVKEVYGLFLKENKDIYRYGDITKIYETLGNFTDEYIKARNKKKITTHAIMPLRKGDSRQMKKHNAENRKVMFLSEDQFKIDGEVRIFGNKVAIMSLKKTSPIAVVIESETISKMFFSIFQLTWSQKK